MTQTLIGFFAPWAIFALLTLLHLLLPGRWVTGYVQHEQTGEKLRYRLNGRLVLFAAVGLWTLLGYLGVLPWDWLYTHRWEGLLGACTFGLLFTFALVLGAPRTGRHFLVELFLGRRKNPQLWGGRIDAKMWLYMVGAVLLALNVLSFTAHHILTFKSAASPGIYLCAGLLLFFILDYLTFEEVHLYTYDLFAERVGFKLGWGCIAFYPYFYAVALWDAAARPNPGISWSWLLLCGGIFFTGWVLARGANMQKYTFKTRPEAHFLGIAPETISDGKQTLLVSGFWGLSRHINYLGEILMATGIALSVGYPESPWPWLYPLYYVALLFPRQRDDDTRCEKKYGALWAAYVERVPYRIIPWLY